MDGSPRLHDEDRADYTAALDDVIGSAEMQRRLERAGVKASRLRVLGLAAGPRVASAVEPEYRSYLALRRQAGGEGPPLIPSLSGPGRQQVDGAGLLPVLAVLTPILALIAAGVFLLLGHGLRFAGSAPAAADTLVLSGWISLGVGVLTAVGGVLGLYRTASRHRALGSRRDPGPSSELATARTAWRRQLREAIRALLLQYLDEFAPPVAGDDEPAAHRPRFSSPRYSGPDFGSPEPPRPDLPTLRG
ncbi:hypothetical protein [Streptomyces sp. NPDC059943]|uniref:hypothetical protein n=1 Tax=Streptomyces sp. NPDC059943 TaxID=3347010 RepID=UPI00364B0013